ncbi:ATP-binding protein [Methylobacterium durans]|uniref:histidine kinase n=1 Tax=Methylobacterium durans TaxID=2202825 RepID=A0A2U8W936_9HYPH|nr:ATP-binding protein [Methylobacterium durans]AWN42529.1 two-component sensor histidine kinase [Methylobacterium durans]
MTSPSLRKTALAWMTALLTLVGLIAMLVAYGLARTEAADFLDGQLRQVALNAGPGLADADAPPAADQDPEDQIAVTIWSRGVPTRSDLQGAALAPPTSTGYADAVMAGEPWRTYTTGNAVWTVQVAQRDRVRREFARSAAIGAAAPILLVIPLSWLVVGWAMNRMLGRLDALARDLADRSAAAAAPLSLAGIPVEVAPLVEGMNGLIARLRTALDAQKRFLADAAHELRTPLAALQIQVDNLGADGGAGLGERRGAIAGGVRRASALVEQLLRLARLDAPAQAETGPVEIVPLLLDCVGEHVVVAQRKGVDLGVTVDAPATLQGSEAELRVLVANLIDNAVRYTPAGGQVDVRLHRPEGQVVIDILDTGCGIPAGSERRIFDRFHRAAPPDEEGSGLGLAIARRIAERNHLGLTVENRRDGSKGVLARVVLPA